LQLIRISPFSSVTWYESIIFPLSIRVSRSDASEIRDVSRIDATQHIEVGACFDKFRCIETTQHDRGMGQHISILPITIGILDVTRLCGCFSSCQVECSFRKKRTYRDLKQHTSILDVTGWCLFFSGQVECSFRKKRKYRDLMSYTQRNHFRTKRGILISSLKIK